MFSGTEARHLPLLLHYLMATRVFNTVSLLYISDYCILLRILPATISFRYSLQERGTFAKT
jgi:hypothetical protein